jgi:hypothetical protein
MDIEVSLGMIASNFKTAQKHLHHIHLLMERLEQTGMYPAIPTEQWQDRDGKGKYLYMLFRQDGNGQYTGPEGKRKVYVGSPDQKIKEAQQMAANRRRWEELEMAAQRLRQWLSLYRSEIENRAREQWPYADLGLPVAHQVEENGPNEMVNEQELA